MVGDIFLNESNTVKLLTLLETKISVQSARVALNLSLNPHPEATIY